MQFLLDGIWVNVTHDDQSLQIGTIPTAVVAAQGLVGEVLHHFHCSDRHTVGVLTALVKGGQCSLDEALAGTAAHTPFLFNDATLLVNFLVLEQEVVAPVVQDEQAGINGSSGLDIYILDIIDGFVEGGIGVEVLTELDTDALQVLLQGIAREMGCTIEAHVLQEMGETALVVFLLHRAHTLGDVEVATLLGPLIVADVIGKSVLQFAHLNGRVHWNWRHLHLLCLSCCNENNHYQQ